MTTKNKHIPDTTYRNKIEQQLNRLFRRHDLQPPAVNRLSLIILGFWLTGVAISYMFVPILDQKLRFKIALIYNWSALLLRPTSVGDLKNPIVWAIFGLMMLTVVLQFALAGMATKKARYVYEAHKIAKQQGRKHPATILETRAVTDGIPLGEYKGKRFGVQRGADAGHVLVAAPTRAGKGLHLTGTLETWHGPAVVVDPKREQYKRTSGLRADLGAIYCLPQHGLDILQYFNVDDSLDMQELFTSLLQTWRDKDPIFSQKAYAIFEAARDTMHATGEPMLRILTRWADTSAPQAVQEAMQYAPAAMAKFTDGDSADNLNKFTISAWGTFTAKFSTIAPHVDTITRRDIPPTWAEEYATIYICYPLDQLESAGGLLSVILTALMKGQQRVLNKNYTLFAIDELRAAGVHALDTKLATVGGYGITILAYLQQLSQLRDVYGADASASIIGNFHHQIFYPTRDNDSAEYVSRKFGTEVRVSRSYSDDKVSYSQQLGAALEPSMVNTLAPTTTIVFTDDLTTLAQRVNPFTQRKTPLVDPVEVYVHDVDGITIYDPDGRLMVRQAKLSKREPEIIAPTSTLELEDDPIYF